MLNRVPGAGFDGEAIRQTASSRLGIHRSAGMRTVNFLPSPAVPGTPKGDRPGLVNPLECYESVRP